MIEGEVEQVELLLKTREGTPYWWKVKLKGREEELALQQNWFALHGDLKPADKVEYEVSEAKLEGCVLLKKLRKVEEKEEAEVKVEL